MMLVSTCVTYCTMWLRCCNSSLSRKARCCSSIPSNIFILKLSTRGEGGGVGVGTGVAGGGTTTSALEDRRELWNSNIALAITTLAVRSAVAIAIRYGVSSKSTAARSLGSNLGEGGWREEELGVRERRSISTNLTSNASYNFRLTTPSEWLTPVLSSGSSDSRAANLSEAYLIASSSIVVLSSMKELSDSFDPDVDETDDAELGGVCSNRAACGMEAASLSEPNSQFTAFADGPSIACLASASANEDDSSSFFFLTNFFFFGFGGLGNVGSCGLAAGSTGAVVDLTNTDDERGGTLVADDGDALVVGDAWLAEVLRAGFFEGVRALGEGLSMWGWGRSGVLGLRLADDPCAKRRSASPSSAALDASF